MNRGSPGHRRSPDRRANAGSCRAFDTPAGTVGSGILKLAPLDVPLRVECSQVPPDVVGAACRGWEGASDNLAPLRLRIEPSRVLWGTGHAEIRVEGARMTVRGPGVEACAEVDRGSANCAISADYLKDPAALRQEVLEPLVLMLLTQCDRTPLHASAFIVDGLAILLAGPSGAGKSCLARAADTAGFQVLSDDTVFIQLVPSLKVWGWPTAAHLLARDAPETRTPTRLRNGKLKHVVPLRSASQAALACSHTALCLLSPPQGGKATLRRITAAVVEERLWPLDEGFNLLPEPIARALARLSAGGAWDLRLSTDPAEAVDLLAASVPKLSDNTPVRLI